MYKKPIKIKCYQFVSLYFCLLQGNYSSNLYDIGDNLFDYNKTLRVLNSSFTFYNFTNTFKLILIKNNINNSFNLYISNYSRE